MPIQRLLAQDRTGEVLGRACALAPVAADAAKVTECTKVGACYCVDDELKPTIAAKVERYRAGIAEQRRAGKTVGHSSVSLSSSSTAMPTWASSTRSTTTRRRPSVSRGAHAEWNIFRLLNGRRRADGKLGAPDQIPMLYDGRGLAPADHETAVTDGHVGKCAP